MADDWHCRQIPNGANPLVVCERADLLEEIERLRAEVARLGGFLHPIGAITHSPCSPTNQHTVVCKCDGRRVVPFFVGSSLRADGSGTRPCDCDKCEGEARRG